MFFLHQDRFNVAFVFLQMILFAIFLCQGSSAQEIQDQEYQLELNPQWYSTDNYAIQGIIGASRRESIDNRNRFYIRPSVAFGLTSEITARVGFFAAYNQFSELEDNAEARPYVGINYYHDFDGLFEKWSVSTYFRLEDRLRYNVETWENEQNWRTRLRFWGIYTLNPNTKVNSWHRIIVGAELLRTYFGEDEHVGDFDDNFDIESRISISAERTLRNKQKVRFDVSWRYQVPFNHIEQSNFSTVVFRIRFYPAWGDLISNKLSRNVDE